MAQVIVEMGAAPMAGAGGAQVFSAVGHQVEEITSSGTAQGTTIKADQGDVCVIINRGPEDVWVRFDGTAAVEAGHMVPSLSEREFGPLQRDQVASIINDS